MTRKGWAWPEGSRKRAGIPEMGGQQLAQALELGLPVGILADEAMRLQLAQGAQAFRQALRRGRIGTA